MDALSELLRAVKLDSAFFFNAEFSAPWSFRSPNSCKLAPYINQSHGHVIVYHLLIEGKAYAQLGDERLAIVPGDVVICPHGDAHVFESGPCPDGVDGEGELQRIFSQGLKLSRMGGGGDVARFVCGFMVCEPSLSQLFLAGLPALFKVNIRQDLSGQWLENSIRYFLTDGDASGNGTQAVLAKLSETLFIETLRRYVSILSEAQTGWLAGARDTQIGKVLALMHPTNRGRVDGFEPCQGGRHVSFSVGAAFSAIPRRNAAVISYALASAVRRTNAQLKQRQRGPDCFEGRVRLRTGFQSCIQAQLRRPAGTLQKREKSAKQPAGKLADGPSR